MLLMLTLINLKVYKDRGQPEKSHGCIDLEIEKNPGRVNRKSHIIASVPTLDMFIRSPGIKLD